MQKNFVYSDTGVCQAGQLAIYITFTKNLFAFALVFEGFEKNIVLIC